MSDGEFILLTDLLGILVCGIVAFIEMKCMQKDKEEKDRAISDNIYCLQLLLKNINTKIHKFTYSEIPTDGSYNFCMKNILKDFINEAFKYTSEFEEMNKKITLINNKNELSVDDIKELNYIIQVGKTNLISI